MAIIKCKMCGGSLEVTPGVTVAECEYCGTKQTLPKVNDEVIQNLFNRANNLRIKCEFDKAEQIYEKILQENDGESEAHWGIVLCKYGIEYVEDPKTFKRIPTCHRTSYDAVITDADYLAALAHADTAQRSVYEAEAKAIDEIQKNILNIVKNEKPFDVFICYKETDENGKRTVDSAIANDIYHQLTQEGLKTFYAAITLEDKLGREYEPYIFAALNSAKVMLVIGTKPEYFSAVWVKNEWSRFMKRMKTDRSKLLIPCFKDMDAYDLPEEFAHLQAQDMGKIGFINDVIRGIKKVTVKEEPKAAPAREAEAAAVTPGIAPLLERAFMFLEDGDWNAANEYCEKVLNIDPKNARAYLGKLMAEQKAKTQEGLKDCAQPFDGKNNYQKAIRFGDEKLKADLEGYTCHIKERNERNENARLEGIYTKAKDNMAKAVGEIDFLKAASIFESISKYKDSEALAQKCHEEAEDKKNIIQALLQEYVSMVQHENDIREKNAKATKCISSLEAQYKNLSDTKCALNKIEVELVSLNTKKRAIQEEITKLNSERSNLGLFAGKRKKEIARTLGALESEQSSVSSQIRALQDKKHGYHSVADLCAAIDNIEEQIGVQKKSIQEIYGARSSKVIREKISEYKLELSNLAECRYIDATKLKNEGNIAQAIVLFNLLGNYKDASAQSRALRRKVPVRDSISAGHSHTVGLRTDGTVVATKYTGYSKWYYGQCEVSGWKDIVAISAGRRHTVGLRADGTVVAVGENDIGQCDVSGWKDIIAISAGDDHTVGLRADGTMVAVGRNTYGQCDVSGWKDIVAISAGDRHTVGLRADGTVVAVGDNYSGQCNVSGWKDIVAISAGGHHTVGLRADGTMVAVGDNGYDQCDVSGWKDIVAISAGNYHTIGLLADGTVVAVGANDDGRCDVSGWKNIVAISANSHTVGLRADGTVVAVGSNYDGNCEVSGWKNIKLPDGE